MADSYLVLADGERLLPYRSLTDLQNLVWGFPGFYVAGTDLYVHLAGEADPTNVAMQISRYGNAFWVDQNFIYFLDLTFKLTAPTDDVTFLSDWVHYAWPFVRMDPIFSGQQGGTITNSEGATTQAKTNGQVADGKAAKWVDYSNTVEGETEGLAIFSHPENAPNRRL